jgi:hypothetical protein
MILVAPLVNLMALIARAAAMVAHRRTHQASGGRHDEVVDAAEALTELVSRGLSENEASVRVSAMLEWREQNGLKNGWVRREAGFARRDIDLMQHVTPATCPSCHRRHYWSGTTCAMCDIERIFWPGTPGDRAYEARFGTPRPEWMGGPHRAATRLSHGSSAAARLASSVAGRSGSTTAPRGRVAGQPRDVRGG